MLISYDLINNIMVTIILSTEVHNNLKTLNTILKLKSSKAAQWMSF